jgi:glycosyltransferase involved in cell wall biosynthesis
MRIAMFTNPFAPLVGGIERSVATFSEDLRALGHEVLVVTLQHGGGDTMEEGVFRLPAIPGTSWGEDSPDRSTGGLAAILDRFAPDVVHAHQPFLLGETADQFARRRGLPLVFTHHTLYGRSADRVALSALEALERATARLAVAYSNRCEAVTAPTTSVAALLKEQGVAGGIRIVPTGIDTERFAAGRGERFRAKHGLPGNAFVAGHLGRLIPAKRVGFLAEAFVEWLAGSTGTHALWCGEGESAGEIRARFHAAGLADRLTLVGNLPDDEVPDAYAAMNVFTFASLTDTQGLVLLEAMAAGVPVLALRATGPQDLVADGVCGRLLDPGATPAAFAEALAAFESSSGTTGFPRAAAIHATSYDRRRCAEALAGVYEEAFHAFAKTRTGRAIDPDLEAGQREVESEWRRLAGASPAMRDLLPTRGFPGFMG